MYISRPTDSFRPTAAIPRKFTLRSTVDSVFSFRRADRRTARNSANLSAADHRVSSRPNTLPVATSMRVQACFSHKSPAWNDITFPSEPTTNLFFHREGIPRIFGLSPIDLSPTMIFSFKDVAGWSVVNGGGFETSKLRKRGNRRERLREEYQKSGWIVKIDVMLFNLIEIFEYSLICSCRFFFSILSRLNYSRNKRKIDL